MSAVDLHHGSAPALAFPPPEHIKGLLPGRSRVLMDPLRPDQNPSSAPPPPSAPALPQPQPLSRIATAPYHIFGSAELPSIEPKYLDLPDSQFHFLSPSPDVEPADIQPLRPSSIASSSHTSSAQDTRGLPQPQIQHEQQTLSQQQQTPRSQAQAIQQQQLREQRQQQQQQQQQQQRPASSTSQLTPQPSGKRKRSEADDESEPSMLEVKQQRFVRPGDLYSTPGALGSLSFADTMGQSYYPGSGYSSYPSRPTGSMVPPQTTSQSSAQLPSGPRRVSAPETNPRSRQGSQVSGPAASPHALGATRFSEPPAHSYDPVQGSSYGYTQPPVYGSYSSGIEGFGGEQAYGSSQSHLSTLPSYSPYAGPGLPAPVSYPPVGSRGGGPGGAPSAYALTTSPSDATRQKPRCWDHGCNGREFSTFSNLLRHQREKDGRAAKSYCPRCGAEFTRSTAMSNHLQQAKCKPRPGAEG